MDWEYINGISCFKKDQISGDGIYLNIEFGGGSLNIHEDLIGWNEFLIEMQKRFPSIDTKWKEILIQPSFERKKMVLLNRQKSRT